MGLKYTYAYDDSIILKALNLTDLNEIYYNYITNYEIQVIRIVKWMSCLGLELIYFANITGKNVFIWVTVVLNIFIHFSSFFNFLKCL